MAKVIDYSAMVEELDDGRLTVVAFPEDGSVRAMSYTVSDTSPLLDEEADPDERMTHLACVVSITAEDDDARI